MKNEQIQQKTYVKTNDFWNSATYFKPRYFLNNLPEKIKQVGTFYILENLYAYFSTETGKKKDFRTLDIEHLKEITQLSKSTIKRAIEEIKESGLFLIIESDRGKHRVYSFLVPTQANLELIERVNSGKSNWNNNANYDSSERQKTLIKFEQKRTKSEPSLENNEPNMNHNESNLSRNEPNLSSDENAVIIDNTKLDVVWVNPQEYLLKNTIKESSYHSLENNLLNVAKKKDDDDLKNEKDSKVIYEDYNNFDYLETNQEVKAETKEPEQVFSKYNFPINPPTNLNKLNLSNEKSINDKICVPENSTANLSKLQSTNAKYLNDLGIKKDRARNWLDILNLPSRLIEDEYLKVLNLADSGQVNNIQSYTLRCLEKLADTQKEIDNNQAKLRGNDNSYYWTIYGVHKQMKEKYPNYFRDIQRHLAQSQSEIDLAADLFKKAEKILVNHIDKTELQSILQDFCNRIDNKNLFGAWLSSCLGIRGANESQMNYILGLVG